MQGDSKCLNGGWASAEVLVGCLHRLLQPPAEPPDAGDLVLDRGAPAGRINLVAVQKE